MGELMKIINKCKSLFGRTEMKTDYEYYKGKCIDEKTYEEEKKKYGLSEILTTFYDGYPDSRYSFARAGKDVKYQVVDIGMGRGNTTTFSFDSEEEAMAWMIDRMKNIVDSAKRDQRVEIR